MEKRKITSEGYFRTQLILFAGMVMSPVTLSGVMVYLDLMGELQVPPDGMDPVLMYVLIGGACMGILSSPFIANMLIAKAAMKATLGEKLRAYQSSAIIRYALLELPSILGLVGFLNSGAYWFLAFPAASVVGFLFIIPGRARAIEALHLSHDESALLNDPKAVVMEYDVSTAD